MMKRVGLSLLNLVRFTFFIFFFCPQMLWADDLNIGTADDLAAFSSVVNGGTSYEGIIVNLTADIDLKDYNWTPIGSSSHAFEGTFKGNNHTITGLTINNGALDNAGLFGYCNGATISYLTVIAGSISADENVGVLAGTLISSTVTGCSVSATSISGTRNVSVLVGYRDKVSGITSCTVTDAVSVSLTSSSDLTANLNKPCNVTLSGRTLYKDGAWNTICLPFDYDPAYGVLSGDGVEVYTLTDQANKAAEIVGDNLILRFGDNIAGNGVMRAGVPYIIKWTSGTNLSNPVFNGVVPRVTSTNDYNNGVDGTNRVRFCGTFDPISFSSSDPSILFMAEGNTLYYPSGKKTINVGAFRAYFKIGNDLGSSLIKDFDINFGDATGITSDFVFEEVENCSDNNKWYTIDGRCIIGKPTEKGLYIHMGRKEIVR